MWHMCPTCFFGEKMPKILHLRTAAASLNNPTQAGCFRPGWRRLHWAHRRGVRIFGQEAGLGENLDGMCEARLSSKMVFPVFILPTILPEKDWEDSRVIFSSLQFHTDSSKTQKGLKLVIFLWYCDSSCRELFAFDGHHKDLKIKLPWKKGTLGHWGHSYSNLIPNLRVFFCRRSYQKSQQLGMPGFPFGDWCLLCGWECCTLCWSHVAGPVSGGVGLCARHIQLCTTCIGRKKSYWLPLEISNSRIASHPQSPDSCPSILFLCDTCCFLSLSMWLPLAWRSRCFSVLQRLGSALVFTAFWGRVTRDRSETQRWRKAGSSRGEETWYELYGPWF